MSGKPKILILKDGSYMVYGGVPLIREEIVAGEEGVPLEWRVVERFRVEEYALCRCGMSKRSPSAMDPMKVNSMEGRLRRGPATSSWLKDLRVPL